MDALSGQLSSFIMVMLTGVAWGVFYDVYHSRGARSPRKRRSDPRDLIFWFISVFLVGLGLILSNWMELRFFVAVGLVLGYVVYILMGRTVIRPILNLVNRMVDRMIFPLSHLKNRLLMGGRMRKAMKLGGKPVTKVKNE